MSAVGSIVVASSDLGGDITRYAVTWLCDASGNVSGASFDIKRGHLIQAKYYPDLANAPSASYDVTLLDADGFDILTGTGANLSASAPKLSVPLIGDGTTNAQRVFLEPGAITPSITNAGNAKGGTVVLIVGP